MNLLFLGTGTSTGVPSLCCDCEVCTSEDRRNKRLRSSLLVQNDGHNILIDTSTDLRQQCLLYKVEKIHTVLYTHHHADHVHGIDELRSFSHFNKTVIPCYGNEMTLAALKKNFSYIFNDTTQIGGGIPQLEPRTLVAGSKFELGGIAITPLEIIHGKMAISGFKLNNVAYITDCSFLPEKNPGPVAGPRPVDPERPGIQTASHALLPFGSPGGDRNDPAKARHSDAYQPLLRF